MFECMPIAALKLALEEDAAAAALDALDSPAERDDAAALVAETKCEDMPAMALDALDALVEPEDGLLRRVCQFSVTARYGTGAYVAVLLPDAAELVALLLEADELAGCVTANAPLVPNSLLMLLYEMRWQQSWTG